MTFQIDTDFPGGNAIIERIDGDVVRLQTDVRDTEGHWFYWCLRVRGAAGRELTLRFGNGAAIGVRGPAMSIDSGRTWRWLGRGTGTREWCRVQVPARVNDCRLSFGMPYQLDRWQRFVRIRMPHPLLRPGILCRTRKGRPVPVLRVGRPNAGLAAVVCARHHACEMIVNYSIEGMVDAILGRGPAAWLAQRAELLIVPFVDLDGVEDGDQGKNRRPHDHNRDYDDQPLYPSVATIKADVPVWGGTRLRAFLSLHCPHIEGSTNEVIYQVGQPDPAVWREQQRFGAILEQGRTGVLPYRQANDMPWGQSWNTAKNYSEGPSACAWAGDLPSVRLSSSFEVPYANAEGCAVTQGSAQGFGRDLAVALARYLKERT